MNHFRNILITFLILNLSFLISYAQSDLDDPTKIKLNKVKTQKVLKYKYEWGEPMLQSDLIFMKKYDENGNLLESKSPRARLVYKYNEKGEMIQEIYFNNDGSVKYKYNYNYDGLGNLTEESEMNVDGSFYFKTAYEYDKNHKRVKTLIYNED